MSLNGKEKGDKTKDNKGRGKYDKGNKGEKGSSEEEKRSQEGSVKDSTQIGTQTFDEFLEGLQGSKKKFKKKKKKKRGKMENQSKEEESQTEEGTPSDVSPAPDVAGEHLRVNMELNEELNQAHSQIQMLTEQLRKNKETPETAHTYLEKREIRDQGYRDDPSQGVFAKRIYDSAPQRFPGYKESNQETKYHQEVNRIHSPTRMKYDREGTSDVPTHPHHMRKGDSARQGAHHQRFPDFDTEYAKDEQVLGYKEDYKPKGAYFYPNAPFRGQPAEAGYPGDSYIFKRGKQVRQQAYSAYSPTRNKYDGGGNRNSPTPPQNERNREHTHRCSSRSLSTGNRPESLQYTSRATTLDKSLFQS